MDNLVATLLIGLLGLRFAPWLMRFVLPALYRRWQPRLARWAALLDVGGGTLMLILIGWLLAQQAWILALVFALLAVPSVLGLLHGLRILLRSNKKDT